MSIEPSGNLGLFPYTVSQISKIMKHIFLQIETKHIFCFLFLQVILLPAFTQSIDSIRVFPAHPLPSDTVKLMGRVKSDSSPLGVYGFEVEVDTLLGTVTVNACYRFSGVDTLGGSRDTFLIGTMYGEIKFIV